MVPETGVDVPGFEPPLDSEWERFFRARNGDKQAWREVAAEYQPRLTALALLITGSATAAEDVVQETFLRSLHADIDGTIGTLHGYLGTVTYRLAVKEARRMDRNVRFESYDRTDTPPNALEAMVRDEQQLAVAEAICSLDPLHRDVLLLRLYGDHTYEQIAVLLDIPLGTVKSRIFNAVKSCRAHLRHKGVID